MTTINVYGQQSSRNLLDEYCKNNWQQDPTRCADYIPKDYQSQPSQPIQQNPVQSNSVNRICPYGSYLGKDAFGNQACLDSKTNQIVSSASSNQSSGNNSAIAGIVIFIIIIIVIAGIVKSRGGKPPEQQKLERQGFPESIKRQVLNNQRNRCNICQKPIGQVGARLVWFDFDHKDGNNWNNDISNCQALCKNCHADKTERYR